MSGWRTTVTMECDDCQEVVYQTLANEQTTVIGTRNRITLPDQMVRHECAPAVPVGVQPEPAEERPPLPILGAASTQVTFARERGDATVTVRTEWLAAVLDEVKASRIWDAIR